MFRNMYSKTVKKFFSQQLMKEMQFESLVEGSETVSSLKDTSWL